VDDALVIGGDDIRGRWACGGTEPGRPELARPTGRACWLLADRRCPTSIVGADQIGGRRAWNRDEVEGWPRF
jgi:hypothetical protein